MLVVTIDICIMKFNSRVTYTLLALIVWLCYCFVILDNYLKSFADVEI